MRKSSTLSAELLRNDEGSSAFEFAVDGQPLIRGNIDSIQASFFRFADGGLPLLHEMSGYFNDGYVESLPMNAYLISCCSCGAPGCGHNWCSIKSLKGNVLLKIFGHYTTTDPVKVEVSEESFDSTMIFIHSEISKRQLLKGYQ